MKKLWLALVVGILLMAASAYAGGPVGGLLTFERPSISMVNANDAGGFDINIEGLVTGRETTFDIDGLPEDCMCALGVGVDWTNVLQGIYNVGGASKFTYTFLEPGEEYYLLIIDGSGNTLDWRQLEITGRDYVKEKARAIVAQCPNGDAFDKAVWLHDYLALNSYYDATLAYHGRDHMLVDGYGVCQSYSEAYRLLCGMAGVDCEIVVSNSMNHEWNAIKLNGKWYEVDATWDTLAIAPAGQGSPANECSHEYFALMDSLMRFDHKGHSKAYTASGAAIDMTECVYMDDNYFVRRGPVDEWINDLMPAVDEIMDSYAYEDLIEVEKATFGDVRADGDNRLDIAAAAVAVKMDGMEHITPGGVIGTLTVNHIAYEAISVKVEYKNMWMAVLTGITEIGEEAFAGTGFQTIEIAEGCETIGSRAFGNCGNLRNVKLPSSVTYIADDAFEGCDAEKLNIIALYDSYAIAWAQEKGIKCIKTIPER